MKALFYFCISPPPPPPPPIPFRRDHKYNHVRIHTKSEGGKTKYYLIDHMLFDSIFELVEHYRQFPLRSPQFEQILSTTVPRKVGGVFLSLITMLVLPGVCNSRV